MNNATATTATLQPVKLYWVQNQSKGLVHVHAQGCGHDRQYGPMGKWAPTETATARIGTQLAILKGALMTNTIEDRGLDMTNEADIQTLLDEAKRVVYFAPCVTVPVRKA